MSILFSGTELFSFTLAFEIVTLQLLLHGCNEQWLTGAQAIVM